MASIHRRSGSKLWQCSFYVGSKRFKKSTRETKRSAALRIAIEMEHAAKAEAKLDNETGRKIHAIVAKAGEAGSKEQLTLDKARSYIAEIVQLTTGEELAFYTVRSWSDEWLSLKSRTVAEATRKRYTASVRAFLDLLGKRSDKPLESVGVKDILQFQDSLRGSRVAKTVNHYIKDIGMMFRAAVRQGLMSSSPVTRIDPLPETDSLGRKEFSISEVKRLVDAAPSPDWQGLITLAAYSGLRLGDCASLRWGSVDLQEGTMTVMPQKSRRKRVTVRIPMHPELQTFMEGHPISYDKPDAPVFPSLCSKSVSGNAGLSSTFIKIMNQAKISRGESARTGGRTNYERCFHSFRHTFTSMLANTGTAEDVRRALSAHLDDGSHRLYVHHSPETLQGAIERLPGLSDTTN